MNFLEPKNTPLSFLLEHIWNMKLKQTWEHCWYASMCFRCQVQKVKYISDKYRRGYVVVLDNPKMTALYWKEHRAPFSNLEASFSFCACPYMLGSPVGWSIKQQLCHRKEQAQSAPGVLRWECLAWTKRRASRGEPRRANQIVAGWGPWGAIWLAEPPWNREIPGLLPIL